MVALAVISREDEVRLRCQAFFADYTYVVRDWLARPHQIPWFSALQALADGVLRHPSGGVGPDAACKRCLELEQAWIDRWGLPYATGYQALCGECKTTNKLLILAFYGSGKSDTLIEWAEWMIGKSVVEGATPTAGWVSYADSVAEDRSIAIRDTIEGNPRYPAVFPEVRPASKKRWGASEWFIGRSDPGKKDPTFKAAGINGSILSFRFDSFAIVDDPQDPEEIRSETYRNSTWRTFDETFLSRTDEESTPIVATANRWWEDDIPGRMIELDAGWAIIITPALNKKDETVFPREKWSGKWVGRSTEFLLARRERNRPAFMTGFMCQPPSQEGDLFQSFTEDDSPHPSAVTKCIQYWDTTTTEKTSSDFNSMTELWKCASARTFIRRVLEFKKRPMETIQIMLEEYWRAEEEGLHPWIVIESAHAGPMFVDLLRSNAGVRVREHSWGGYGRGNRQGTRGKARRGPMDLYSRANAVSPYFDGGQVFFPRQWLDWTRIPEGCSMKGVPKDAVFTQLKAFTAHSKGHDDIVASIVGGVEYLYVNKKTGRPNPSRVYVRA